MNLRLLITNIRVATSFITQAGKPVAQTGKVSNVSHFYFPSHAGPFATCDIREECDLIDVLN